jgi:GxxExxY protein
LGGLELDLNKISEKIIGCAIKVHKILGAGLLESIYESALCIELHSEGLKYERQKKLPVNYKGIRIGDFFADLVVENMIIVEIKSVERFDPVFESQVLSYMKLGDYKLGLLINFNSRLLKTGVKRYII